MIDIDLIRKDPNLVRTALEKRESKISLDRIVELDKRRRELIGDVEKRRNQRNDVAKQIGKMRASGQDTTELQAQSTELKNAMANAEAELASTESELQAAAAELPNIPDDRVVAGGKENNQVVKVFGEQPKLPAKPLDHVEMSSRLGLVDHERGAKLSGSGFWIYKGWGAALEWALIDFFNREHFADGYTFLLPPHMLLDQCGFAAGQFPKFREDVFHIKTDEDQRHRFLLPTAETAILNVYRDEILDQSALPIKAFAYTPCYRREAGTYRTEERGTIRGHQFNKVEMFQFTTPEDGEKALAELVRKAETLMEKLGLHYRTSQLAAGDTSASMAMTYDVEVWIPSIGIYKEVSSASWAKEYQARRANIRYRPEGKKGTAFIHTLNASGLATSRLLPAILEQHQRDDGSLNVPEPLRAWLGTSVIEPGKPPKATRAL
ncbi:MAG: serine--tRNA ligase [Polyangiaceae bacterium]|nr:serine--tRNA ligase [Polyangiaceae bacterium]